MLGRSSARRRFFFTRQPLTEKITQLAPDLDIYIIPDQNTLPHQQKKQVSQKVRFSVTDLMKSLLVLAGSTAIGFLFFRFGFSEANIITVYILGVLVIAVITPQRVYSLISSLISVLLFNFFSPCRGTRFTPTTPVTPPPF